MNALTTRIAHICFGSTNLAATRRFFTDFLGYPETFVFTKAGKEAGFYVNAGNGQFIEVFETKEVVMNGATAGIRHICLEVPSLEAVIAKAKSMGYPVTEKKVGADQTWQCWVDGPDGLRFEFQTYTDKSSQKTGAPVEINW